MSERIEIALSKKKIILLFIGSTVFIVIGLLGIIYAEDFVSPMFKNPHVIRIAGIAGVIFFGIVIVFIARKLFDKKPGLIIDAVGITDNTNATSAGLIEWNDITGIEKKQVTSTKFLVVHTNDPEKYVARVGNFVSKQAAEMNRKTYGSPITITSNSIKMNFEDLETLIITEFNRRKA